ncbi:hypothetical protein [[Clostridium] hylemonae]|uniref:Uncharacterized protein n=1 Tax=[Clostridium] hylemonae DSM 15053 TaxID=553973 RepID=C0BYG0_9FIRM|nr:hypothetical protein [[Clostridium] hylemonae]EEG74888.1 hypothetical protein CLOHYLEM_04849 [[Clostridium] hylemonae DSM 15053]MCB7520810.1 hypothetical protein [[Clostridium] hylemonae]QEK18249.1 hypothetical protein LAJLEIBI_02266 [[Clostridium] hylemonae DSM 15053]BDF05262.1 hypothetical protein CE91St63_23240 [[Clostridium] hylemonae]
MKVKKRTLLLLAGLVWSAAGFNILRIGIVSYSGNISAQNLFVSCVIFALFWFLVFGPLVKKHTLRIRQYKEIMQFFLKFFDGKSFCIMAFMMSVGIGIRVSGICPDLYIAVFYTGLGFALTLAGLSFTWNYFRGSKNEQTGKEICEHAGNYGNIV